MSSVYIAYHFIIEPLQPASEILIAELGYAGFESFVESEKGITAYIQKEDFTENILKEINILKHPDYKITYTKEEIEQINWNEEWEKNFTPIQIEDICTVRAPFHEKPNTPIDIIIEPKMSFGTGHHETTFMMMQLLLKESLFKKEVLDMGCGTGVLAILSEIQGATSIQAIDIDNWCYQNTLENIERNRCKYITVKEGDASLLKESVFDVIIANINKNILLEDISAYQKSLDKGGILLLSGFYKEDMPVITNKCQEFALEYEFFIEKNNWVAVKYVKN